jgi:hypothetical protein
MEISLRKPQRELFQIIQRNPGSFLRRYRKSLSTTREYYRLMTKDFSPIKNVPPSLVKPMVRLSLFNISETGELLLKPDLVLLEKKPKQKA